MELDARAFRRALQRVCDIFKIPSLYSKQEKCLEALFKGKDVYASLPTGYIDIPKSSKATRFLACSWESLNWFEEGVETGNGTVEHFFDWTIF